MKQISLRENTDTKEKGLNRCTEGKVKEEKKGDIKLFIIFIEKYALDII